MLVSCSAAPQVAQNVEGVVEVSRAATAAGIMKSLAGADGTMILRDTTERFYMLVWDVTDDGACFWVFDVKKITAVATKSTIEEMLSRDGNLVNIRNFNDLTEFLKGKGWNTVTAAELSLGVRQTVAGYLSSVTKTLPTFVILVLPTGEFDIQDTYNPVIRE